MSDARAAVAAAVATASAAVAAAAAVVAAARVPVPSTVGPPGVFTDEDYDNAFRSRWLSGMNSSAIYRACCCEC